MASNVWNARFRVIPYSHLNFGFINTLNPVPITIFKQIGIQPTASNTSCFSAEADGHLTLFDDNRDPAGTIGMLQHDLEFAGIRNHIMILHVFSLLLESFTSCIGVRSGALSENQNFLRHISIPPSFVEFAQYV